MARKKDGFPTVVRDWKQTLDKIRRRRVAIRAVVTAIVASVLCCTPLPVLLAWRPAERGRSRPAGAVPSVRPWMSLSPQDYQDGDGRNLPDVTVAATSADEGHSALQAEAARLRREALDLQRSLEELRLAKIARETEKIDKWIDELLIEARVDDNTELLKTVDGVLERLRDDRYSAEQVNKIFKRLCDVRHQESRSDCSPLMSLLVDAAGRLDSMERKDNPNKRWSGRVERVLRKKLFARDWNMELDDEDESDAGNPWRIR